MNLPNKLTLARIIAVPVFVVLYMRGLFIPAFIIFILASLTDMDPLADKILVYSAFCLMVEDGAVPSWMLIIILLREFAVSGMRTVAAANGIVIAAGMSGKIKTVLQMIAVPLLILRSVHPVVNTLATVFLWASLVMTVYSGVEYIVQNKQVFKE